MTTFVYSRPRVAAGLASLPVVVPYLIAKAGVSSMVNTARQAFSEVREDIVAAFRYVVTGNPNKTLVAATVSKASSIRQSIGSRISDFYWNHIAFRLHGLFALMVFPFLALFVMFHELVETGFFADAGRFVREAFRSIVSGEDHLA